MYLFVRLYLLDFVIDVDFGELPKNGVDKPLRMQNAIPKNGRDDPQNADGALLPNSKTTFKAHNPPTPLKNSKHTKDQ